MNKCKWIGHDFDTRYKKYTPRGLPENGDFIGVCRRCAAVGGLSFGDQYTVDCDYSVYEKLVKEKDARKIALDKLVDRELHGAM